MKSIRAMDGTMEAVERTISQRNQAGTLGCNPVESQGRTTTATDA